ncbi:aminoglycoside phosphotransferase family protein [Tateyamaria sp.]|jgi:aminoglycoside/choline kinase family phosphotransferase|uniref:aminoglycoside phosphotransferase family protein n=1 Tax=Tateyamaria sp. TaxID=1929288 RepID=UPI0032DCB71E
MPDRPTLISSFLDQAGWGDMPRTLVAGDASNRRYERLERDAQTTAILMDAPPDKGEDVRPFVHITNHLREVGLSAPEIYAQDDTHGLLLIEDLGDDLFARVMAADSKLEEPLYAASVDVLVHLHRAQSPDLPRYDADIMTDRAALAYDWYQRGVKGSVNATEKDAFVTAFRSCLVPLDSAPAVLIQRDYHAENLIWLPKRTGVRTVGLLEYQDAMLGHPAYDLVSIVQDARREVPEHVGKAMIARYIGATQLDEDPFRDAYALLGAQRNLRILGVFARLSMHYGKPHYVDLIPRVWGHIQTNLSHPALASIKPLIDNTLPVPNPDLLQKLKDQCATIPLP